MKKFLELRDKKIELGKKTLVMGILNITPDSFSDGGFFYSAENALIQAKKIISSGADIIDIGAESTRPNFKPISAEEEILRLEKILPEVANLGVPISIDTYKPEVAEFALKNGAEILNDVTGLENAKMLEVAKKFNAPVIAMHNKKNSADILDDIKNYFSATLKICQKNDMQVIFDVGIGFGKTQEENLKILQNLEKFKFTDREENILLLGASRKSFIGWATGFKVDNRDEATGAICCLAISKGVDIVRVHNVEMISKICKMTDFLVR